MGGDRAWAGGREEGVGVAPHSGLRALGRGGPRRVEGRQLEGGVEALRVEEPLVVVAQVKQLGDAYKSILTFNMD